MHRNPSNEQPIDKYSRRYTDARAVEDVLGCTLYALHNCISLQRPWWVVVAARCTLLYIQHPIRIVHILNAEKTTNIHHQPHPSISYTGLSTPNSNQNKTIRVLWLISFLSNQRGPNHMLLLMIILLLPYIICGDDGCCEPEWKSMKIISRIRQTDLHSLQLTLQSLSILRRNALAYNNNLTFHNATIYWIWLGLLRNREWTEGCNRRESNNTIDKYNFSFNVRLQFGQELVFI